MSKSLAAHLIISLAALACSVAQAGTVEQAVILADPQMQVKDGLLQGCGYRLKSAPKQLGSKSTVILDSSVNLYASGMTLLKGGAIEVEAKNGAPDGVAKNKPIQSFWLKVQSEKATVPRGGKVIAAETKGYLLYGISLDEGGSFLKRCNRKRQSPSECGFVVNQLSESIPGQLNCPRKIAQKATDALMNL